MLTLGRVLLGAFDDPEQAAAFVERVAVTPTDVVRSRWPRARDAFLAAPPLTRTLLAPLDATTREAAEAALAAPIAASALASKRYTLAMLPLGALVVPQPMIQLMRVKALQAYVAASPTEAFFPMTTTLDVAVETEAGPAVAFVSSRGELTVSGANLRRLPDDGAIEVVFRVEPRPNYVSAVDEGGVFALRNGHHRLVAAWRLGLRAVPCVIVEGSIEALAARMKNGLPLGSLLRARPPLLYDLAEDGPMTLEIELRQKRHVLRLAARLRPLPRRRGSTIDQARFDSTRGAQTRVLNLSALAASHSPCTPLPPRRTRDIRESGFIKQTRY